MSFAWNQHAILGSNPALSIT